MATNANQSVYYLYGFNSYSDRRCIKYDTLADYLALTGISYDIQPTTNFCEGDGVVRPNVTYRKSGNMPKGTPNYAIVCDSLGTIQSRWYVVDSLNKNVSTYSLTLKRDSVADFYDHIITAPTFIERGILDPSDKMIFNDEGLAVNQIKQGETLLKDRSKCAWVVGYLANDAAESVTNITQQINVYADYRYTTKADFESAFSSIEQYMQFSTNDQSLPTTHSGTKQKCYNPFIKLAFSKRVPLTRTKYYNRLNYTVMGVSGSYSYSVYDGTMNHTTASDVTTNAGLSSNVPFNYVGYKTMENIGSQIASEMSRYNDVFYPTIAAAATRPYSIDLDVYNNKVIKIGDEYFKMTLVADPNALSGDEQALTYTTAQSGSLPIRDAIVGLSVWDSVDETPYVSIVTGNYWASYYLQCTKITSGTTKITLTGNETICKQLPYKVFYIPYCIDEDRTPKSIAVKCGSTSITMSGELAINLAKMLSTKYSGAQALYDIQLLPYCPEPSIIYSERDLRLAEDNPVFNTWVLDGNDTKIGCIFWASNNEVSFDISHTITSTNPKLETICDMYRLASPNWNGQFEFSPAKNGGVAKFNIDCTYKPHMPYIHVNPDFNENYLYGKDWNDARGLICQGNFSLPQTSEAWNTYELQNKNYENQFRRQIENMEVNHKYNMVEQGVKMAVGTFTGAASGATAGGIATAGNPIGMGVGAAIGGVASLAGGITDLALSEARFKEQKSYTQDMHDMQLDNIKAIPSNLTNVGALTYNNKLFPVLEYYTCSDEERQAILSYLMYYGMAVNRVGYISNFINNDNTYAIDGATFVQGQIIRLTIDEENHMVDDIRNEIKQGVFIK